jgi:nucleotide-binding universal stress UspA family protein
VAILSGEVKNEFVARDTARSVRELDGVVCVVCVVSAADRSRLHFPDHGPRRPAKPARPGGFLNRGCGPPPRREVAPMQQFAHPRVVVGVDRSLTGLAALRAAVAEARRRGLPLYALRARTTGIPCIDEETIQSAFLDACGSVPVDIEVHCETTSQTVCDAMVTSATDPRDLIVVGNSGRGAWHAFWSGSVSRGCLHRARCAVLAVPAPELARTAGRDHRWRLRRRDLWDQFERETPALRG